MLILTVAEDFIDDLLCAMCQASLGITDESAYRQSCVQLDVHWCLCAMVAQFTVGSMSTHHASGLAECQLSYC